MRNRHFRISAISLLAAAVLVYATWQLQLHRIRMEETISVVAPRQFIQAGTVITSDMIGVVHLPRSAFRQEMLTDPQEAIGQEAAVPLGRHEPLLAWKLGRPHLHPGGGRATFHIPKSYILSISSGIRAGDRVIVYASGPDGMSRRLFEEEIVVASVKSAAWTEVEDVSSSRPFAAPMSDRQHLDEARKDATAPIDHINLNLTEEQWLELDRLCASGQARLVIAFSRSYAISAEEEDRMS